MITFNVLAKSELRYTRLNYILGYIFSDLLINIYARNINSKQFNQAHKLQIPLYILVFAFFTH